MAPVEVFVVNLRRAVATPPKVHYLPSTLPNLCVFVPIILFVIVRWGVGNSRSHVVVMAGRWIMYDNGGWDFKIDNERMAKAVDFSQIKGVNGLKDSILASYGLLGRDLEVEMCYWLIDGESEMVGKGAAPVEIATDTDYKIFKALHMTDKSCNVFVTFREIVGKN